MHRSHPAVAILASLLAASPLILASTAARAQSAPVYKNPQAPLQQRVSDLLNRLTEAEKLSLLGGTGFTTQPIPRLGVPAMAMDDAGQGVRGGQDSTQGPASQFPSGVTMASSWDPALIGRVGRAIGDEARNKGTGAQVLLGPDVNIQRSPLGGRDGEQFTEDPYLNSRLAVAYIEGLQGSGDAACVKHFAANNEEVDRMTVDVHVSRRALREIYLPAFKAAVEEAHVWTIMPSYNVVNGYHSTANRFLLTDVARGNWRFDGTMISDWGAVHETARVVNAGNDLEMPTGANLSPEKLQAALQSGEIKQSQIDLAVRHILTTVIRVGLLNGPITPDPGVVNSPAHQQLTYQAAAGGIVLLKNRNGILPLDSTKLHSIAVIGPAAVNMQYDAQGSPALSGPYEIDPLDGITKRAGAGVKINYVAASVNGTPIPASALVSDKPYGDVTATVTPGGQPGLKAEYFNNQNLEGQPTATRNDPNVDFNWQAGPIEGIGHEHFSVRWTGEIVAPETGHFTLNMSGDDGYRLYVNNKLVVDHWVDGATTTGSYGIDMVQGRQYPIRAEYFQDGGSAIAQLGWITPNSQSYNDAVAAAKASDVAIVCVNTGFTEGEGNDRPSMDLPNNQDALIKAVAAANKNTIVVLNNGTPVTMTGWLGQVPGLVEAWLPGQEGGHALASILFGDINPSGKLPTTLAARREDYPDYGNFPGNAQGIVHYAEGVYVGYRHFDKAGIAPLFPFGYGLSYTTFKYSNLKLSSARLSPNDTITATVNISNTGQRPGAEVVEMYLHDPRPQEDRPVRELKGFDKVTLQPGETKTVTLTIAPQALAYFDEQGNQWKADAGQYQAEIGSSSRDIKQTASFTLASIYTNKNL